MPQSPLPSVGVRRLSHVLVLVLAASSTVACDSEDSSGTSGLSSSRTCSSSSCSRCNDVGASRERLCSSCLSTCSNSSFTSCSACDDLCTSRDCSDECSGEERCTEYELEFETVASPNRAILDACTDFHLGLARCGTPVARSRALCERFAEVEDPDVAPDAYACFAALPCDATDAAWAACDLEPRHDLAQWYCANAASHDDACQQQVMRRLEQVDGWLRDSVARSIRACDGEKIHMTTCVESWLDVVEANGD